MKNHAVTFSPFAKILFSVEKHEVRKSEKQRSGRFALRLLSLVFMLTVTVPEPPEDPLPYDATSECLTGPPRGSDLGPFEGVAAAPQQDRSLWDVSEKCLGALWDVLDTLFSRFRDSFSFHNNYLILLSF